MKYIIDPEQLARRLVFAIDEAKTDWAKSTRWTLKVKSTLRSILQSDMTDVIFTDTERRVSEFLLDLVAWNGDDGEGMALAAECEWNSTAYEVRKDFEKLLVVKSPIKLMIFATWGKKHTNQVVMKEVREALLKYKHHLAGERYVFVDFAKPPDRRAYWLEMPKDGRLEAFPSLSEIDIAPSREKFGG